MYLLLCSSTSARLQFRLPDGSSVTNTFPADPPLETIRQYIITVSFKQIQYCCQNSPHQAPYCLQYILCGWLIIMYIYTIRRILFSVCHFPMCADSSYTCKLVYTVCNQAKKNKSSFTFLTIWNFLFCLNWDNSSVPHNLKSNIWQYTVVTHELVWFFER